ncbi:TauD/TfdA family dioxygenase [Streptomyces sp. NPDC004237]|uniref:TauD/TfdA dioxygenase family protein n=1 Tax=Streptomyces sp. NPDC004237 TaxID=3154455 RepID=UPI0033B3BFEB
MAFTYATLKPFGVEVTGAAGHQLVNQEAAEECRAALDEHGVVVYRELNISDDELVALSRLLGDVVTAKTGEHRYPEIATITLDPAKTNAALATYRQGNFLWHIDGATDMLPQKATLLTAREVDDADGDTEFANTYLAYESLPDEERAKISDLRVAHSFAAAQLRANPDASEQERAAWDQVPSTVHPLVWTRRNGRKSLLLGATAGEIVGLAADEGRALLDHLLEWATQPRFALRHHWRRGDLVIWDNTGMLHRALPFDPTSRRLMHRTTLVGEETVA